MTTVAQWPVSINQRCLFGTLTETPERNVSSFRPEFGAPLESRDTSIASDLISFEMLATDAEWTEILSFYRSELKDGVLDFARSDPSKGGYVSLFRFAAPPSRQYYVPGMSRVSLSLRRVS